MNFPTLKVLSLCAVALLSINSGISFAAEACSSDAIDPDGDGWGWEGGKSCKVGELTTTPLYPVCVLPSSDPDGDGFGWEANATCKVDENSQVVAGDSYDTALTIQFNESVSASMNGLETHYYQVNVPESTAYSITTNFLTNGELDVQINTGPSTNNVYSSNDWEEFDSGAKGCLAAGTNYLVVQRYYNDTFVNLTYDITLNEADMTCKDPSSTVIFPRFLDLTTFRDDLFYYSNFSVLTVADITGTELWSVDLEDDYIQNITPLDDATVLLSVDSNKLHLIDSIGQIKWSQTLGKYYDQASSVHEIGDSILLDISGSLYSLSKSDGTIRWASTHGLNSYGGRIFVTDDNRIIFLKNGQARVFDN